MIPSWTDPVRLVDVARSPPERRLVADEAARGRVAAALGLEALPMLEADVRLTPWLDGARVSARWRARVVQICGVTLDPFETELAGDFEVTAVPEGSPALSDPEGGEIVLDADAPDPPDVLEEDRVDPAAYVVEHLALAVDPYPRKPGAEFEPPEAEPETSPFAVLAAFKDRGAS